MRKADFFSPRLKTSTFFARSAAVALRRQVCGAGLAALGPQKDIIDCWGGRRKNGPVFLLWDFLSLTNFQGVGRLKMLDFDSQSLHFSN